jgi:hypothetical protein
MDAKKYISFFYGNKEEAIIQLEKSIALYENSKNRHTPKVVNRIQDYKLLLSEIKSLSDERT